MLTYDEAKKIGINACIDHLGRDFVTRYRDNASSAYGDRTDHAYCFVGVSDQPEANMADGLRLTSMEAFPYIARCNVYYETGDVTFLDCVLPDQNMHHG